MNNTPILQKYFSTENLLIACGKNDTSNGKDIKDFFGIESSPN
jgi:hypothetical protein